MDDITAILRQLRTTAGFSEPETAQQTLPRPVNPGKPRSQALTERVMHWAGSDYRRWRSLHTALLRIYSPRMECTDARDVLVAWTASWVAFAKAEIELAKAKSLRPPLTNPQRHAKSARLTDANFWVRLATRLEIRASEALSQDADAARVLVRVLNEKPSDRKQ